MFDFSKERDRQTDRQTDRRTGRQTDRQTDRQTETDRDKQSDRQTKTKTETETETETETKTKTETERVLVIKEACYNILLGVRLLKGGYSIRNEMPFLYKYVLHFRTGWPLKVFPVNGRRLCPFLVQSQ